MDRIERVGTARVSRFATLLSTITLAASTCAPIDAPGGNLGEDPLGEPPGDAGSTASESDDLLARFDVRPLEIGEPVPAFALTDQEGARLEVGARDGKSTVLTFFESRSPDPALCPELIRRLSMVEQELRPDLRARVNLVAVSVDPSHDTATVLRDFAASHVGGSELLRLATGDPDEIVLLSGYFGVVAWRRQDDSVAHTLNTVVIDGHGRLHDRFPGVDNWSTMDLLAAVVEATQR